MKKYKLSLNKYEFSRKYARSKDWITLKDTILRLKFDCFSCGKEEADSVHHLYHGNLKKKVSVDNVIPVCKDCHALIHKAMDIKYMPSGEIDKQERLDWCKKIATDKGFEERIKWLSTKHYLPLEIAEEIKKRKGKKDFIIKQISSMIKKPVWYDTVQIHKFTGHQIDRIKDLLKTAYYRKNKKKR